MVEYRSYRMKVKPMKKIQLYAGTSENIQVLEKVKILNCRQSAGKTRIKKDLKR